MKNILNLVIYLLIIYILVMICNNLFKSSEEKTIKKDEKFTEEKIVVRGNPTISFNYDTVPPEEVKKPILDRYIDELKSGANFNPEYKNNTFTDQRAIYNNDMYVKPIHVDRKLEPIGEDDLPKTISQVFDESITDFKKLTPLKTGKLGDFTSEGASNLSLFNPDYISYDDEKPENGGKYDRIDVFGYDPLTTQDTAVF